MPRSYKAPNKRIIPRSGNGRFRKTTMADFGIGGICQKCRHLLVHHYDGDENDPMIDPRKFRYRCFTCEPMTEKEQHKSNEKLEKQQKKNQSLFDAILKD